MTDREKIIEIIARYVEALEARDGTAVAALFAPGGMFTLADGSRSGEDPTVAMSITGRDDIAAVVGGAATVPGLGTHYLTADHIVDVRGEEATFRSRFFAVESNTEVGSAPEWSGAARMLRGSLALTMLGRYRTDLTKADGTWRITTHQVVHDLPLALPATR